MGEAKRRGTYTHRKYLAIKSQPAKHQLIIQKPVVSTTVLLISSLVFLVISTILLLALKP